MGKIFPWQLQARGSEVPALTSVFGFGRWFLIGCIPFPKRSSSDGSHLGSVVFCRPELHRSVNYLPSPDVPRLVLTFPRAMDRF